MKSFAPSVALSNLGSLSLWASLKFIAAILIVSMRTSGSSEMHSESVIPRMGRGRNTGGAMYCWVPVADAAVIPAALGGGGGLVSSVDAPL